MEQELHVRGIRTATLIACLVLLALAPAAFAEERWAEPMGNGASGEGGCVFGDPCSIQAAVEDASVDDGDLVTLKAGPYNLGTDQLLIDDDITIEPAAGLPRQQLSSTFDMSGWAVGVEPSASAPGAVLRRLLISHDGDASSFSLSLKDATAEQVYVVSNSFIGCGLTTGTLRDSVCFLTAAASDSAIGAVGTSIGGAVTQQSTLRNVTAISKEPNAPGLVLSAAAGANLTINGRNVIAESSTFDVFASAGAGSTATISLANSNYPIFDAAGAGASVTSNALSGNQATPPLFTNYAGNNFSQAPGSPTIDGGAIDPFIGALDVDGNPRVVQGKAGCPNPLPDIGAFEAPAMTPIPCPAATTQPTQLTPAPVSSKKCKKKRKKRRTAASTKKKKKKCPRRKRKK